MHTFSFLEGKRNLLCQNRTDKNHQGSKPIKFKEPCSLGTWRTMIEQVIAYSMEAVGLEPTMPSATELRSAGVPVHRRFHDKC